MKRCWFAVILLVGLLVGGLWVTGYMTGVPGPLADSVDRAGAASLTGNWVEARQNLHQAKTGWEAQRKTVAVFADHEPMENIDALFAQLENAARWEDGAGFSSLCAHLREMLEALGEAHGITWWNLL